MRVGLITTEGVNVGDDLVRAGIVRLLKEVLRGDLELFRVNKHKPTGGFAILESCDVIVQCGGPVIWEGCRDCEWATPLWYDVISKLSRKGVPVLNLGAGSCYPWGRWPEKLPSGDAWYLHCISSYCRITTVRDDVAQRLLLRAGIPSKLLPCPSLFASNRPNVENKGNTVFLNFMELGGHYDWGNGDCIRNSWRSTMTEVIKRLERRVSLRFLCHSRNERALAGSVDNSIPCTVADDAEFYFDTTAEAKAVIGSRIHAAMALAGVGVPSVVVGNDTRLMTVDEVGLPHFSVDGVTVGEILNALEALIQNKFGDNLLTSRDRAWERYVDVLRSVLPVQLTR